MIVIENIEKSRKAHWIKSFHYLTNFSATLNICFPYTSRDDIAQAMRSIAIKVEENLLEPSQIDEKLFEKEMLTGHSPPLDIFVRTSGATRLSDFMIWQSNQNATIEFIDPLWPDFKIRRMFVILLKWSYRHTKELT